MEWLKTTLDEFETKKEEEKTRKAEEKAALEKQMKETQRKASDHIAGIYKQFLEVKRELQARKYPCEADLRAATDTHTNEQRNTSATLVVSNRPLSHGQKLSSGTYPSLTYKENGSSDSLSISYRTSDQDEFKKGNIQFSKINKEAIEEMISKFVKGVFS